MAKSWTHLTRTVTSGSTVGQPWKGQSQDSYRAGLALYLDTIISPDHARQKNKQAFYPCSSSGHATKLRTLPVCIPSTSLTVLDWRESSWLTEMRNKKGTNTGNSCAALVRHQEQVSPPYKAWGITAPAWLLWGLWFSDTSPSWWHCCFSQSLPQTPDPLLLMTS